MLSPDLIPGKTPYGSRNMIPITGGTFEGPGIRGIIVPGGWDWQLVRADGCVDVIAGAGRELVVAGADTGPRLVEIPAGTLVTGVRLRPGAAGPTLGVHAAELRDRVGRALAMAAGRYHAVPQTGVGRRAERGGRAGSQPDRSRR